MPSDTVPLVDPPPSARGKQAVSYVFYDCETTGVNRSFDQILQFAAVRTDDQLREIDSIEVRSRLLQHIVPSVKAIRANRINVHQLTDETLPTL
jgi:exodeoxyribonuclease-1